ncbi:hypothetical protein JW948_05100 [bacterium]|nr:hypothetical protein [bacterium]
MNRAVQIIMIIPLLFLISGCASRASVSYSEVVKNNWVYVTLNTGEKIEGTVQRAEPHLLTIHSRGRNVSVEASRIHSIERIPPMYDDFGNAISEEEIADNKTNKNKKIYGIGGGILSFGISFFTGSMLAQSADDGGTILAATTGVGTILGTVFFIHAGGKQDRKEAVQRIREKRKSTQIRRPTQKPTLDELRREMNEEKKKQEELRKQREQLLRELDKTKTD